MAIRLHDEDPWCRYLTGPPEHLEIPMTGETAAPDPLAAELAAIRERARPSRLATSVGTPPNTAVDALRLADAVERVLERHVRAVLDASPPFPYCQTCSGHPAWPCPEVAAISAALLGQDTAKGGSDG